MTIKTIVKGTAKGIVMKTNNPINFLGAVDKKTGFMKTTIFFKNQLRTLF